MVSSTREIKALIQKIETFVQQSIPSKTPEEYIRRWSALAFEWSEAFAWTYIRYTCNTADKAANELLDYFIQSSETVEPLFFQIKENFAQSPASRKLGPDYDHFLKILKNDIDLFRKENVPLGIEDSNLSKEYQKIMSNLSIEHEGKEYTLQQCGRFLESGNRETRREVWEKIFRQVQKHSEEIQRIYSRQIELRHRMAENAGFSNFRDFAHQEKGRFDYTPQDCLNFHDSIEKEIIPFYNRLLAERKAHLKLETLRPYDLKVDEKGQPPLHPFHEDTELVEKTLSILRSIKPQIGKVLEDMREKGHLDLSSRKSKAPGGYNYPLLESGSSFIFMNAAGLHRDVITLLHESGHALQVSLNADIENLIYKHPPMEVAELASMSMELLSMPFWDRFYPDPFNLKKAKLDHLKDIVSFFPWMAAVDAFQHWVYLNPGHTKAQRLDAWEKEMERFGGNVDWNGYEAFLRISWERQSHILEVPFYYIEYGIAQLGALQVWKNYLEKGDEALDAYIRALAIGYRRPIREIYEEAGISFDFSPAKIREIMDFLEDQIQRIERE